MLNARLQIDDGGPLADVRAEGEAQEELRQNPVSADDVYQEVLNEDEMITELIVPVNNEQIVQPPPNPFSDTDSEDEDLESLIYNVKPFLQKYSETCIDVKGNSTLQTCTDNLAHLL